MKYLIHTEGKIVNLQGKSYRVKASTKEEAQQLAREQFIEEYGCNGEIYTSKAIKTKVVTAGSIIGMLIAVLLSFINWKSEHATISIQLMLLGLKGCRECQIVQIGFFLYCQFYYCLHLFRVFCPVGNFKFLL